MYVDIGAAGLTQLTVETLEDSDQDQPHSGSQSLSQKVCLSDRPSVCPSVTLLSLTVYVLLVACGVFKICFGAVLRNLKVDVQRGVSSEKQAS